MVVTIVSSFMVWIIPVILFPNKPLLGLDFPEFVAGGHCVFAVEIDGWFWLAVGGADSGEGEGLVLDFVDGADDLADAVF